MNEHDKLRTALDLLRQARAEAADLTDAGFNLAISAAIRHGEKADKRLAKLLSYLTPKNS
jgi:hypothetical protein